MMQALLAGEAQIRIILEQIDDALDQPGLHVTIEQCIYVLWRHLGGSKVSF